MERDNAPRWDGNPGHYEVWYLTCNHRESQTGYWIRYTMEAPARGAAYAQLWFACFDHRDPSRTFGINRVFPIELYSATASPFSVRIGDAALTNAGMRGALSGNGHQVRWDLSWLPAPTTHRHLPAFMYRNGGLGDTTVLSPNLDVPVRGTIEVDGDTRALAGDPGGQTHVWGRKHAHQWAWGHCNAFEGRPGAALEVFTARLKKAGRVLPPTTVASLYVDGEALRFEKLRYVALGRGETSTGHYAFRAQSLDARIEGVYACRPEDMVMARYADPDGDPAWCAHTDVADLRVTVWRRAGVIGRFREVTRLLAPGTGHFEIGARTRDPAVVEDHATAG